MPGCQVAQHKPGKISSHQAKGTARVENREKRRSKKKMRPKMKTSIARAMLLNKKSWRPMAKSSSNVYIGKKAKKRGGGGGSGMVICRDQARTGSLMWEKEHIGQQFEKEKNSYLTLLLIVDSAVRPIRKNNCYRPRLIAEQGSNILGFGKRKDKNPKGWVAKASMQTRRRRKSY